MYFFLVKRYVYTFSVEKDVQPIRSTQLLFKTRFFVSLFTKFSVLDGVYMDAYRLYNQTFSVVQVSFQLRA